MPALYASTTGPTHESASGFIVSGIILAPEVVHGGCRLRGP